MGTFPGSPEVDSASQCWGQRVQPLAREPGSACCMAQPKIKEKKHLKTSMENRKCKIVTGISLKFSVIPINVDSLIVSVKRQGLLNLLQKQNSTTSDYI